MEIEVLVQKCIKLDRRSQREFYDLTCEKLMNVSRRYTSHIDEAKDVLQNAYIKIFSHLKSFDINKGNLDAWMTKIVINESLQLYRKKKIDQKHLDNIKIDAVQKITPEIINKLYKEDIIEVVQQLPDGFRMVFNMYEIEGYSHKEISKLVGITEGTSRSQLSRAKEMLRKLILVNTSFETC